MKFILNKDKLEINEELDLNSGAINYYGIEVEHDSDWDGLTIEAVMIKRKEKIGTSLAVINNKVYIDRNTKGKYSIGFVGYKIENNQKIKQISTNLLALVFGAGAGEITTQNEELPTPTEWEIYVAEIRSIVGEIEGLSAGLESRVSEVETALENGDFDGADGISPTLSETATQDGYDVSITDINGTRTIHLTNGQDGRDGVNGSDGYTPVRGTDYWTSSDISEIEQHCDTYIDGKIGSLNSVVSSIEEVVG